MSRSTEPMHPFEEWSRDQYALAKDGQAEYPEVLLFERSLPRGLAASGKYVNFSDFKNIERPMSVNSEYLVRLFHTLVLHFAGMQEPDFHKKAYDDLRYRPDNHSNWNTAAPTYNYHLLGQSLIPLGEEDLPREHKIKGIGEKARPIIRAVLYDEVYLSEGWRSVLESGKYTKEQLGLEGYEFAAAAEEVDEVAEFAEK